MSDKSNKRGRKPGTRKTGGRQKGTPNKVNEFTQEQLEEARGNGETPLQFMMRLMNTPQRKAGFTTDEWMRYRGEMAKSAAPYYHPRLVTQKVEMGGHGGGPLEHTVAGGVMVVSGILPPDEWNAKYGSGLPPVHDVSEMDEETA